MSKKMVIILLGIALLTSVLMLITFNYLDGQTILAWSVNTYDVVFEGRIRDFYIDKQVNLRGALHLDECGTPWMLLPETLWNLPVWLTHYFNGNYNVATLPCIYWYKLSLLLTTGLCGYVCYKIVYRMTADKNRSILSFLLVFASAETILSTMYAGQDEVVYILFFLLAIYAIMNGKRKAYLFWATCSISCCPIMLVPFLTIELFVEKKITKLIRDVLITLSPAILWAIVSYGAEAKDIVNLDSSGFMNGMLNLNLFSSMSGKCSVIAVLIVFLYFKCYYSEYKAEANKTEISLEEGYEQQRMILWYSALSMVLITFLSMDHFYRLFMYVPFVVILMLGQKREENTTIGLFLLTLLSYIRMFNSGYKNPQSMNTSFTIKLKPIMDVCNLTGSTKYDVFDGLTSKLLEKLPMLESYITVMNGAAFAAIALLLYINHPKQKKIYAFPIASKLSIVLYFMCMPLFLMAFYALLFK